MPKIKKKILSGILALFILCFCVQKATSFSLLKYLLVGELKIVSETSEPDTTIEIFRNRIDDDKYLIKIKRNSVDSKFMRDDVALKGWITIPIPVPLIPDVVKKHRIKYHHSDTDSDFFMLELTN